MMTDEQIKHMAERFLMWKLPPDFRPDNGISAHRPNYAPNIAWEPTGTNLFDYEQAKAMVHHMVEGISLSESLLAAYNRIGELHCLLNTPEVDDFTKGAVLEAAHQRERWGVDHDAGKTPWDWFWLIGYLSQKAAHAAVAGDVEKAKHHTISTAAALANWHLALMGKDT